MKKISSLLFATMLLISVSIPTASATFQMPTINEMKLHLTKCGIAQIVLNQMDDFGISSLYEESLNHYIEVADFSVTNDLEMVNDPGISVAAVTDGEFELTTTVFSVYDSDRVTFKYFAVYTKFEWTDPPVHRKTDGITINWDNTYLTYTSGSFHFESSHKYSQDPTWAVNYETDVLDESNQGGVGVTFDVYNGYNYCVRGTAFIKLEKIDPNDSGYRTTINSNYAHTTTTLAANSLNVTASGVGVVFTCETVYQNSSSSATVTIP